MHRSSMVESRFQLSPFEVRGKAPGSALGSCLNLPRERLISSKASSRRPAGPTAEPLDDLAGRAVGGGPEALAGPQAHPFRVAPGGGRGAQGPGGVVDLRVR